MTTYTTMRDGDVWRWRVSWNSGKLPRVSSTAYPTQADAAEAMERVMECEKGADDERPTTD